MKRTAGHELLGLAKHNKNDEFYTQLCDIERELQHYRKCFKDKTVFCNCDDPLASNFYRYFVREFRTLGLKKVIAACCGTLGDDLFTEFHPGYYCEYTGGEPFPPTIDTVTYFKGNGDFRSRESVRLLDESDIVVTNPPFSLFIDFFLWLIESQKQFLVIGNINAIKYKEVFPQIMNNNVWLGNGMGRWISGFVVPEGYELYGTEARIDENGNRIVATNNCLWLTNLEHGRRHQPLELNTMAQNIKHSKHKEVKGFGYQKYDNYDALEVPYTDSSPSDYDGVMGVPITFLDKYCPEQFQIVGEFNHGCDSEFDLAKPILNGKELYPRIAIKKIGGSTK